MVDLILEAATQVLIEDGYEGATTNRIAQRAGVSIGSLYQYYPNKEAVVAALFDRLSEKAVRLAQEHLGRLGQEPLPLAIRRSIAIIVELYRSSPELIEMTLDRLPELDKTKQYGMYRERFVTLITAYLQARRKEVREGDLAHIAWTVSNVSESMIFRIMKEKPDYLSTERLLSETGELLIRYLSPEPAR